METYQEYVGRYRILRHEELPPEHKAGYRLRGIDPDDLWSLIWSFDDLESAEREFERSNARKPDFYTYRLVDAGAPEYIERSTWF